MNTLWYIHCETSGDEEMCVGTREEAIEIAKEMLKGVLYDDGADDMNGEVLIFEPTMVISGAMDVKFDTNTYVPEEEDTDEKE